MNEDWTKWTPSVTLPNLARWFWCFLVGHKRSPDIGHTRNYTCLRCRRHALGA